MCAMTVISLSIASSRLVGIVACVEIPSSSGLSDVPCVWMGTCFSVHPTTATESLPPRGSHDPGRGICALLACVAGARCLFACFPPAGNDFHDAVQEEACPILYILYFTEKYGFSSLRY